MEDRSSSGEEFSLYSSSNTQARFGAVFAASSDEKIFNFT
jgi:hypothetical protein